VTETHSSPSTFGETAKKGGKKKKKKRGRTKISAKKFHHVWFPTSSGSLFLPIRKEEKGERKKRRMTKPESVPIISDENRGRGTEPRPLFHLAIRKKRRGKRFRAFTLKLPDILTGWVFCKGRGGGSPPPSLRAVYASINCLGRERGKKKKERGGRCRAELGNLPLAHNASQTIDTSFFIFAS